MNSFHKTVRNMYC